MENKKKADAAKRAKEAEDKRKAEEDAKRKADEDWKARVVDGPGPSIILDGPGILRVPEKYIPTEEERQPVKAPSGVGALDGPGMAGIPAKKEMPVEHLPMTDDTESSWNRNKGPMDDSSKKAKRRPSKKKGKENKNGVGKRIEFVFDFSRTFMFCVLTQSNLAVHHQLPIPADKRSGYTHPHHSICRDNVYGINSREILSPTTLNSMGMKRRMT